MLNIQNLTAGGLKGGKMQRENELKRKRDSY